MFALLTASMFIKGPIVFAFLLPGIVLFQWLARESKTANTWCGSWPWIASLALFSIWVICGVKLVPGFYEQVLMKGVPRSVQPNCASSRTGPLLSPSPTA